MKLEFLDSIDDGGKFPNAYPKQLIRLYDFRIKEAKLLKQAFESTLLVDEKQLALHELTFIQPVNCGFTLHISVADKGIVQVSDKTFICYLPRRRYEGMVRLIEPFCNDTSGFQWLYEWGSTDSEIELLFSPYGSW